MLGTRLVGSAAIIAPLVALVWADYAKGPMGLWLFPLGLVIVWAAIAEVLTVLRACGLDPLAWVAYAATTMVFFSSGAPLAWEWFGASYPADCPMGRLGWPLTAMAAAVALAGVGEIARFTQSNRSAANLAASILVIAYIGLLGSFFALLRGFEMNNRLGMIALVSTIFVVKMADSGAYVVGRAIGRTKLAPQLSPGKTVEGAVGGFVTGCLSGWLFLGWLAPVVWGGPVPSSAWTWLGFGLVVSLAGFVGDLFESLLKRDAQLKDSSTWLPGLGGVLDVLDSLLFAAPVAFVYWSAFLSEGS